MKKERAAICIQSHIRGYLQRRRFRKLKQLKAKLPLTGETAATIIQKCYRGFMVRKAYYLYRQRLSTQILCFLQQIELISNDFFIKTVKTNYSVGFKNIEPRTINVSHHKKYLQKFSQYLFPPPPPLPLPSPFSILSPPLPPPDAPALIKPSIITSSISLPPPPPSLFLASRPSPQPRHQVTTTTTTAAAANRPPSPVSNFAQVRDIFARAEAAAVAAANVHHHYSHHNNNNYIPIKIHNQMAHVSAINNPSQPVLSIEKTRSPKSITVLDAVQEYQRQHLSNHHAAFKRFGHCGIGAPSGPVAHAPYHNRSVNFVGNNCVRPRGIGAFISSNAINKPMLQHKPAPPVVLPSHVAASPKQHHLPSKAISPVNFQ